MAEVKSITIEIVVGKFEYTFTMKDGTELKFEGTCEDRCIGRPPCCDEMTEALGGLERDDDGEIGCVDDRMYDAIENLNSALVDTIWWMEDFRDED